MEIRKSANLTMEDSGSPNQKSTEEEFPRPISPCDSEISVGCENDSGDVNAEPSSPIEMISEPANNKILKKNGETPFLTVSRTLLQNPRSPRTLSPASTRDESESISYLSDDEYFRPLKRLAMSESSPHFPGAQRRLSEPPNSSPEPPSLPPSPVPQQSPKEQSLSPAPNKNNVSLNDEEDESEEGDGGEECVDLDERRRDVEMQDEQKLSGLRSFSILDILSYKPSRRKSSIPVKIVRPWDTREDSNSSNTSSPQPPTPKDSITKNNSNNNNISVSNNNNKRQNNDRGSALDALFKMTNKTLDNLNKEDKADAVNLFNNRQPSKKKRKSRTAFTNHQIFELEKRFLYQKYLSPADRDELAQSLGLSNAQVITWFQNRRAKLKRDMEELKRDVQCSSTIQNKALLEASANVVAFLKAKDLPKLHLASLPR